MKRKGFLLLVVVAFCFVAISCSNPSSSSTPSEATYTVWTDLSTYSDFQTVFNSKRNPQAKPVVRRSVLHG